MATPYPAATLAQQAELRNLCIALNALPPAPDGNAPAETLNTYLASLEAICRSFDVDTPVIPPATPRTRLPGLRCHVFPKEVAYASRQALSQAPTPYTTAEVAASNAGTHALPDLSQISPHEQAERRKQGYALVEDYHDWCNTRTGPAEEAKLALVASGPVNWPNTPEYRAVRHLPQGHDDYRAALTAWRATVADWHDLAVLQHSSRFHLFHLPYSGPPPPSVPPTPNPPRRQIQKVDDGRYLSRIRDILTYTRKKRGRQIQSIGIVGGDTRPGQGPGDCRRWSLECLRWAIVHVSSCRFDSRQQGRDWVFAEAQINGTVHPTASIRLPPMLHPTPEELLPLRPP